MDLTHYNPLQVVFRPNEVYLIYMLETVKNQTPRLHLGCGNRYLEGYVNIDYPNSDTTIETDGRKIDIYADIKSLRYAPNSVSEVRLHHVFEHFDRPTAVALLGVWNRWLVKGGQLRIEVPDIQRTFLSVFFSFWSLRRRMVGIRHIFGSHEAHWAIHMEGWTKGTLSKAIETFGFKVTEVKRNSWRATYNLEIIATKTEDVPLSVVLERAEVLFKNYLLDEEATEMQVLHLWLKSLKATYQSFETT